MERIDKGWTAMHTLLDEKMPQKKKRRKVIFFWLFSAVLVLGSAFVYHKYSTNENAPIISKHVELNNLNTSNGKTSQKLANNNSREENTKKDDKINNEFVKLNNSITRAKDISKTSLASENITLNKVQENKININKAGHNKTPVALHNKIHPKTPQQKTIKSQAQSSKKIKLIGLPLNQNTGNDFVHTISNLPKSDNSKNSISSSNSAEVVSFKKDIIADLGLLASLELNNTLQYKYNLTTIADNRLIDVTHKSNTNQLRFNFGASTSGSYFVNENVLGITPALFMEIEKNNKWGIGLELGSTFAKRNNNDSEELRAEDLLNIPSEVVDVPSGLGAGFNNEVLADEDRGKALDIYTSNLNSIGIGLYGFLNINNKLRSNIGIGLDHFYNKKSLNNVYVSNQNEDLNGISDPALGTRLFSQSKIIANSTIGISYGLTNHFDIFTNYKHAWVNLVEESDFKINTSSIQIGGRFTF